MWHSQQHSPSLSPHSWVIFISKLNTQCVPWCNHCSSHSTHCLHCLSQMFLLLILSASETANPSSTTVNNECFFRSCSNTLKFQRDLWELSDSHSAKYHLPMAKAATPAMGHLQVTEPGIFLQEATSYVGSCRNQALICAESKLHHTRRKWLIFWHCSSQCAVATFTDLSIQLITQLMAIWFQWKCMWLTLLH